MTPITSCHGMDWNSRNCLPRAADGVPHNSRAKFSEIITTGRSPYTSLHVNSRPAINRVPAVFRKPGEIYLYRYRGIDRKSTRLNSSHLVISYAVFCLTKKKKNIYRQY